MESLLDFLSTTELPFSERKNTAADPVRSITVGIVRDRRGHLHVSRASGFHEGLLCKLLLGLLEETTFQGERPQSFTSICLNVDYAATPHVDRNNRGLSSIVAFGDYEGGELWLANEQEVTSELSFSAEDLRHCALHPEPAPRRLGGQLHDIRLRWTTFDGSKPHAVVAYTGRRISVVFFSTAAPPFQEARLLHAMKFPYPYESSAHPPLRPCLPFQVCVASSRRSTTFEACTMRLLIRNAIDLQDVLLCVRDDEDYAAYDRFRDLGIRLYPSPDPARGLPAQRRLLESLHANGQWLLFLDDDVMAVRMREADGRVVDADLREVVVRGFLEARNSHVGLWGLNTSSDQRNLVPGISRKCGLVNGYFFGRIKNSTDPDLRYSDAVEGAAEDIERSVRFASLGGLLRLNFAQVVTKPCNFAGGLSAFFGTMHVRTAAHAYVVLRLCQDFPHMIKYDVTKPLQCRFLHGRLDCEPQKKCSRSSWSSGVTDGQENERGRDSSEESEKEIQDFDDDLESANTGGEIGGDAERRSITSKVCRIKRVPELMERGRYDCDLCQKSYVRRADLVFHQNQCHADCIQTKYPCEGCGRLFKRRKDIKAHTLAGRCFSARGRYRPAYGNLGGLETAGENSNAAQASPAHDEEFRSAKMPQRHAPLRTRSKTVGECGA